jgi:DNA-binding response OmpR family regulator
MLVVENDPMTRKALHQIFDHRGWEVRGAAGIAEALRELDRAPDCIILDLALPDGDGETILEANRAREKAPCAIVVTGLQEPARLDAVRQRSRAAAVFLKPVKMDQIFQITAPIRSARTRLGSGD